MKVGIFYFSTKDGKDRRRIIVDDSTPKVRYGYLRIEVLDVKSASPLEAALNRAKPRADETVLNTVEV
jgi:hypothetical protein